MTAPTRTDLVGALTRCAERLREAVAEVDGAMRDMAFGASDLTDMPDLPPDFPLDATGRARDAVALEYAARAVLPARLPGVAAAVEEALGLLTTLRERVVPLPTDQTAAQPAPEKEGAA